MNKETIMTTYKCNKATEKRLNKIKERLGADSTSEVLRQAVAILEVASRDKGTMVTIKSPLNTTHIGITIGI